MEDIEKVRGFEEMGGKWRGVVLVFHVGCGGTATFFLRGGWRLLYSGELCFVDFCWGIGRWKRLVVGIVFTWGRIQVYTALYCAFGLYHGVC